MSDTNNEAFRELATFYLEGELTEEQRLEFERTLAGSASARAHLAELQALDNVLSQWQAPEPSADFADRVRARIVAAERSSAASASSSPAEPNMGTDRRGTTSRVWRIPAHVAVAATALLAVSIGFNVLSFVYNEDMRRSAGESNRLASDDASSSSMMGGTSASPTSVPAVVFPVAYEQQPLPTAYHFFADPRDTVEEPSDEDLHEIVP